MTVDLEKGRRENLRWTILVTLQAARPLGAAEQLILTCVTDVLQQVTLIELRRELEYLADRGLVAVERNQGPQWRADLTRCGVDVVEYTVACDPGIARPQKYW